MGQTIHGDVVEDRKTYQAWNVIKLFALKLFAPGLRDADADADATVLG